MWVITDRYFKLTSAIPTFKTTASHVASLFPDYWIAPIGIPVYLRAENKPRFESKYFELVNKQLDIKHLATTPYHPQSNKQSERFNETIVTRLRQ